MHSPAMGIAGTSLPQSEARTALAPRPARVSSTSLLPWRKFARRPACRKGFQIMPIAVLIAWTMLLADRLVMTKAMSSTYEISES